jgi:hypothetical protein
LSSNSSRMAFSIVLPLGGFAVSVIARASVATRQSL